MKALVVSAAKKPIKPGKQVPAKELFVESTAYDSLSLVCKMIVEQGGFGNTQDVAKRILTGKYTKDTSGGKALANDIQLVYDLAIRNLSADRKTVLSGLMKT